MKHATSDASIHKIRTVFATHGFTEMLVTDNGSTFTSAEFREFTHRNAIRHVTTAPYHPSSNGLAERAVQSFKNTTKMTSTPIDTQIANFLFQYHLTPHTTAGLSLTELLLVRHPHSLLDNLWPICLQGSTTAKKDKSYHDLHASSLHQFQFSDPVFGFNFSQLLSTEH